MTVPVKLAGFLTALAAVFGVSFLAGTQAQTLIAPVVTHAGRRAFGGLSASAYGYTLALPESQERPGDQFVEFTVTGPDGHGVGALTETDGAPLHLVAIRRDLTGYQHIYPDQNTGASWWAALDLTPGPWHLVVDFQPSSLRREVVLGIDLTVSGDYVRATTSPAPDRAQTHGFTVTRSGGLDTYGEDDLTFTVTRDGRPVTDLIALHASLGHALLIRADDLGYLHLHANPAAATEHGPRIVVSGDVPATGRYLLFLEFAAGEQSYTVPFTLAVTR